MHTYTHTYTHRCYTPAINAYIYAVYIHTYMLYIHICYIYIYAVTPQRYMHTYMLYIYIYTYMMYIHICCYTPAIHAYMTVTHEHEYTHNTLSANNFHNGKRVPPSPSLNASLLYRSNTCIHACTYALKHTQYFVCKELS